MKTVIILLLLACTISYGQRSDFNHIDFKKADSIALGQRGKSLKNLPVLTHNLTANLATDVEKFRAIYTWVSTNIENDYSSYLKTRKKREKLSSNKYALLEWNNSFTPKVFENLLKYKKTACTGYAYLIRELSKLANINCKIIDGYGRTANLILDEDSIPNHSWNAVELNDKWYFSDATWSAGQIVLEDGSPRFVADYYDGYFLADPALFLKNHYPLEVSNKQLKEVFSFQDFLKGPVIYKEAFSPTIIPLSPTKMHLTILKNEPISFIVTTASIITNENIVLILNNGTSSEPIQPKVTRNDLEYTLNHTFAKTGKFDVHIKMADAIIATYVVKVKRK